MSILILFLLLFTYTFYLILKGLVFFLEYLLVQSYQQFNKKLYIL